MRVFLVSSLARPILPLLAAGGVLSISTHVAAQPAPDITQPPQSQAAVQGANITFTVVATGQTPFTYQWWREGAALTNGGRIAGAHSAQLDITGVLAADAGSYTVTVYDRQGDPATSSPATLTVLVPPAISQQPQSRTNLAGTNVTFTASATGIPAPAVHWQFNGTPVADGGRISGATTGALTITNLQPGDAGNYRFVATNSTGSATSVVAQLVVWVPPTFSLQPEGRTYTYFVGNDVTFASQADGIPAVSYQWFRNGDALTNGGPFSGAQAPSLAISAVQTNDEGSYWVVAANAAGASTSAVAVLDVLVPARIVEQPQPTNVVVGGTAMFSVMGAGDPPLTYRWQKGTWVLDEGGRFSGTRSPTLQIVNVQPEDAGDYSCWVFGVGGESSAPATLTVLVPPAFTNAPLSTNVVVGNNFTLTATAATGTAPISYQWFFNDGVLADGARIQGAHSATLAVSAAETNDSGFYQLVASNIAGVVTNAVASVSVGFPPVVTQNPASRTNGTGSTAQFLASATGTEPLGYRWYFGTTPLSDDTRRSGTTTTNLSISDLVTGDSGQYTVVVTNAYGSATSEVAVLTVLVPPAITTQPIGRSVAPGLPVIFTSAASGSAPLTYRWQLNGADLPGATNRNYTNLVAGLAGAGDYRVIAANPVGAATSVVARLTIGNVATWGTFNFGALIPLEPPPGLSNAVAIAGGSGYSLALRSDGMVTAWGSGLATSVPSGLSDVVGIAAGPQHALALNSDGTVVAWGSNSLGQTNVPSNLSNVVAIAAGSVHSAALRADGTMVVWGDSRSGQRNIPPGLIKVEAIDAGGAQTLALRENRTIAGWGTNPAMPVPARLSNIVAIATSAIHALALHGNGTVTAWGFGPGTNVPSGLTDVIAIDTGTSTSTGINEGPRTSYVLRSNGTLLAWGVGVTNVPAVLTNVVAMAGGVNHMLALVNDGRPLITRLPVGGTFYSGGEVRLRAKAVGEEPLEFQWLRNGAPLPGENADTLVLPNAQFSDAGSYKLVVSNALGVAQSVPVPVAIVESAPKITWPPASGFAYHGSPFSVGAAVIGSGPMSLHWLQNGAPLANGPDELVFDRALPQHGGSYQLVASNAFGSATSSVAQVTFTRVATWGTGPTISNAPVNLGTVTAVAAGRNHLLALQPDGTVDAWGPAGGFVTDVPPGLDNVEAIGAGDSFSVALRDNGAAVAWGLNSSGQTNVPASATNLIAISAGDSHTLGLRDNGTVIPWGISSHQTLDMPPGLSNVVAVSAGLWNSLALKDNGTVVGWGSSAPPPVTLSNVVAIAAGYIPLALRVDGTVVTWSSGGAVSVRLGLSNIVAIAAGTENQFSPQAALRSDGTVFIWPTSGTTQFSGPQITSAISLSGGGTLVAALLNDGSPAITVQPWNRRVNAGAGVTLAAFAAGRPPLHYQWRFNGADLPGATNATLNLPSVTRAQRGAYSAIIWNDYGSTNSRVARLDVGGPLKLLAPEFSVDGGLTFSATDSFGAPLTESDLAGIELQASTNLVNWTPLPGSLTLSNGVLDVEDPAAQNHPARFYRLVEP